MAVSATVPVRRETLNIRIKTADRSLIDRATELTGKSRTDFILDATSRAAEDALLDQTRFGVEDAAYAKFLTRLEAPPAPNDRLPRTLRTPAPWDSGVARARRL